MVLSAAEVEEGSCLSGPDPVVANAGVDVAICEGSSTILTATGGTSYTWNTGATTSSITATTAGSYSVTVTNANGCSDTSECLIVDQVGIFFPESAIIGLYPNPTSDFITLELPAAEGAVANVYDAQGKLILSVSNAKNGQQFDLSALSTGVYTFRVTLNNLTHIEKVVKQ
mgnify:CR=1 FL=1